MRAVRHGAESKKDQTKFRLTFDPASPKVEYSKISGNDWVITSGTVLRVIWADKNALRLVAQWTADTYRMDPKQWSPVFIFDIDYASPNVRVEHFGGFADFDIVISDPWKLECRRTD